MSGPLINILIRTSAGRRDEFKRCLTSCYAQTYTKIKPIICSDSKEAAEQVRAFKYLVDHIQVTPTGIPFHWNFYCNNLKERVTDGWFFYLDDDDYLAHPKVLEEIAPHLNNSHEGVICQFNRGNRAKPQYGYNELLVTNRSESSYLRPDAIIRGKIGGSCIFLHHTQKNIADWDGGRAADYRFIKAVAEWLPLKWVPKVVVQAGNKGRKGQ